MVYKSGQIFLPFCHNSRVWQTDRQTDRRTEFSSLYRVCITCSAVKTVRTFSISVQSLVEFGERTATEDKQVAQLSQRDCAAEWVNFGQKWKTIFYRQYRSIFNHCDIIGLKICRIRWNKAK